MATSDGGSGIVFQMTGVCVLVGVVWFLLTGAVWQFLPIGAAVYVTFQVAKALNAK
jgi:hypothetical protein